MLTLAHVEAELGSLDAGRRLCAEALALEGVSVAIRGLVYSQLGLLWMRAGDGGAAVAAFAEAEPLLGSAPEPLSRLHLNRGNVYLQRGDAAAAAGEFEQALNLAEAAGEQLLAAKSAGNLGYTRMLQGDMVGALRLIEQADESFETPVLRAVSRQDRAEVLLNCGMPHEAATALREAAAAFGSRKLRQSQAEAELTLAQSLLRHDPVQAGRIARRARRRFDRRGSEAWALRADAVIMASESLASSQAMISRESADELAHKLQSLGLVRDAQVVALHAARSALRAGDLANAAMRLRRAKVSKRSALPTRLFQYELNSELALARGRRRDGRRFVERGLAELHDWQATFGSLDLQSSLVGHGQALARRGLSLAVADRRPEVVFEWSERARALAGRVAPVRPPADEDAARDLTELRRVQAELAAAENAGRVPRELRRRADELRLGIRQRAWYEKGSGRVTEPETLAAVQGRLCSDEVVVSILAVDDQLTALVTTDRAAEVVSIGPLAPVRSLLDGMQADLDMAAAHLPAAIRQSVHAGLGQRLVRLSSLLVGPWSRRVRDRRVVVVPSGALAGTPWTLLPDLAGLPITVPRSASEWINSRDARRRLGTAGFVAGPRVDRAHEEIKRAAHAWPRAQLLEGRAVQAEAVRELASRVDVLHVAAHGRHSADNPLFSGLELADGPWFGYDIDQVAAIPSTVVLSACELGRSTVRWGEETLGMTVAWLYAGARCVVASPASVDDDVACEVLAATHQLMATGTSPADALAVAMSSVESGVAPFICFGSGW